MLHVNYKMKIGRKKGMFCNNVEDWKIESEKLEHPFSSIINNS